MLHFVVLYDSIKKNVSEEIMARKILSAVFAFILIFSVAAFGASAAKSRCVANVQDAMNLCREQDTYGIYRGTLYTDGKRVSRVYLIVLSGSTMSWEKDDIKSMYSCIKAGTVNDNDYLDAVLEGAKKQIPEGAKVVLIGHSLGGMVAQQFAADKEMKERYEILNIMTMGTPYIPVIGREGELRRMADSGDAVPYFSIAGIGNLWLGNFTYKDNGYFGDPDSAHNISYNNAKVWKSYDCFGIKDGTNKIYY